MTSTLFRGVVSACFLVISAVSAYAQQAQPAQKPTSAATQKPSSTQKSTAASHHKTLALLAGVGGAITITTVSNNAFNDGAKKFSVLEWKVDDRVASQVGTLLPKDFAVKRIAVPAGAFDRLEAPHGPSRKFDTEYRTLVQELAASQKADFYLTVTPGYSRFEGDQIVSGLGIVESSAALSKGEIPHCLVLYRLYDSQFNLMRSEGAMIGKNGYTDIVAGLHVANSSSKKKKKGPARDARLAASDANTKDVLLDLLNKDVAATVPKLFSQ